MDISPEQINSFLVGNTISQGPIQKAWKKTNKGLIEGWGDLAKKCMTC